MRLRQRLYGGVGRRFAHVYVVNVLQAPNFAAERLQFGIIALELLAYGFVNALLERLKLAFVKGGVFAQLVEGEELIGKPEKENVL